MTVEDDGCWCVARYEPYVESRIVGKNSVDADQNCVVAGANGVGNGQGFGAANGGWFSTPGGDTTIQALGIAERNKGTAGVVMLVDALLDLLELGCDGGGKRRGWF